MKKNQLPKQILAVLIAGAALTLSTTAHAAANWREWTVTKTTWSPTDERAYSEWVQKLGETSCYTVDSCLKSPANFFANAEERASVNWVGDCGRFPYVLRAYFAWKNHLPFGYVNAVAAVDGSADLRYSAKGNTVTNRVAVTQKNAATPIDGVKAVQTAVDDVFTANYRFRPETDISSNGLFFDFTTVAITREFIHPGTTVYDPNGHVLVVYKVEDDGRIRLFDAHPDNSVSHGVYGEKFVRSSPGMGAGFKNFRPIKLVGAQALPDGRLIGGQITTVPNDKVPGYSAEQYYGTNPVAGSWSKGTFVAKGQALPYYDWVRTRMAVGDLKYHPVEEMTNAMDALCQDLQDRITAVDGAINNGMNKRAQPEALPANIYGSDGDWETFSSPSRDARLKTSFHEVRTNVENFIQMYNAHSPRIDYQGTNLLKDLQNAYAAQAAKCTVTYKNSAGQPRTLTYDEAVERLFAMDFDPYHCIEHRWGATTTEELRTCTDDSTKQAWYAAEQNLRNQLDRAYGTKMGFTLDQLKAAVPGSGVAKAPDVDLKGFLAHN